MVERLIMQADTAKRMLLDMVRIRVFEDVSAEQYSKGTIGGFMHLYSGQEAVAVGTAQALRPADIVVSTYREHGHALVRGIAPFRILAEMFGFVEGCCKGRGGSMHLFDAEHNLYGGNAIVASHLPVAVGMALAQRRLEADAIVCCYLGDGAAAEGVFAESLNLAALWNAPVVFVCENNHYAMGTALERSHAQPDIARKGKAYGVESATVDGMDLVAVVDAMRHADAVVRTAGRPYLLVCNTYRFRAHSMFDAERYRTKEEVAQWKLRDPITLFTNWATACGLLTHDDALQAYAAAKTEIDAAVAAAALGTVEPLEDLERHTYAEELHHDRSSNDELPQGLATSAA